MLSDFIDPSLRKAGCISTRAEYEAQIVSNTNLFILIPTKQIHPNYSTDTVTLCYIYNSIYPKLTP